MKPSQRVVQVCLFLVAAIAMVGGTVQMVLGQPDTSPRLDNVHRFMAGVYFSIGLINLWAASTIRRQGTLSTCSRRRPARRHRQAGLDRARRPARAARRLARLPDPGAAAAVRHRRCPLREHPRHGDDAGRRRSR